MSGLSRRQCLLGSLAACAAPAFATNRSAATPTSTPIDWPALPLLDGGTLAPASWQGQAAVVVFWSTTCPFCKRHNAHVDRLYRATLGQPLRVLGVALDRDADAVRQYLRAHDYRFPVVVDGSALRSRLTTRRVIPMTCVIDPQGRVAQAIPGEMFEEDVLEFAKLAAPRRVG